MSELPEFEVYFYLVVWSSGVCLSLYHLFLVGRVFDHGHHDLYHYEDFKKGWALLGQRYQDQADYEWNTWTSLFIDLTPFLVINFLGAEYIRHKKYPAILPLWYGFIAISFLLCHFNTLLTIWFLSQALIYLVNIHLKSHLFTWVLSFTIIQFLKPDLWFAENDKEQYLIMVSSSWLVLRCVSFSAEKIYKSNEEMNSKNFGISDALVLLGYSFYLPTMFCGPFISYSHFDQAIKCKPHKWTINRIVKVSKSFVKCIFWYFFTLFALHFIYVNAILLRPEFVRHLLDWELAGLGIAMGHFFHLKYVVFYGIPCAWASAEGFATPKSPCCVSRVHLYSYMWRNFDQGLYQFLVRYIYIPIISRAKGNLMVKKLVASIGCFAFMFTWHRGQDYVFFWVFFNFIAIAVEIIAKQTFTLPRVQNFIQKNISSRNRLRFECLLAAPLHCFSMISNYFFIGNGMDIGLVYLNRVLYGSFWSKLTIWFFLYGAGQSAVATQKWTKSKKH